MQLALTWDLTNEYSSALLVTYSTDYIQVFNSLFSAYNTEKLSVSEHTNSFFYFTVF